MNEERERRALALLLTERADERQANGFTVLQAEIVETLLRDLRERHGLRVYEYLLKRCGLAVADEVARISRAVPLVAVPVVEEQRRDVRAEFHKAWGEAKNNPGYDKDSWMFAQTWVDYACPPVPPEPPIEEPVCPCVHTYDCERDELGSRWAAVDGYRAALKACRRCDGTGRPIEVTEADREAAQAAAKALTFGEDSWHSNIENLARRFAAHRLRG